MRTKVIIVLVCSLPVFPFGVAAYGHEHSLDLDETLGLAFQGRNWVKYAPFHHVSLDERAESILQTQFDTVQPYAVESVMGIIGLLASTPEDIEFIESKIVAAGLAMSPGPDGNRTVDDGYIAHYQIFESGLLAIAYAAYRGVNTSEALLRRMTLPEYWRSRNIQVESRLQDVHLNGMFKSIELLHHFFPETSPDPKTATQSTLEQIGITITAEQREQIARLGILSIASRWPEEIGEDGDRLADDGWRANLRRQTRRFFDEEYRLRDEPIDLPVEPIKRKTYGQFVNNRLEDFGFPLFSLEDAEPADREFFEELRNDAIRAFFELRPFLDDESHFFWIITEGVLVRGRPTPEALRRYWRRDPEAKQYQRIVEVLREQGALLSSLPDELEFGRALFGIDREEDEVLVGIPLRNTVSAAREHLDVPDSYFSGGYYTFTDEGDLVLVMRRIKGSWYWNLFGM